MQAPAMRIAVLIRTMPVMSAGLTVSPVDGTLAGAAMVNIAETLCPLLNVTVSVC